MKQEYSVLFLTLLTEFVSQELILFKPDKVLFVLTLSCEAGLLLIIRTESN
jgi:hypothetical protein